MGRPPRGFGPFRPACPIQAKACGARGYQTILVLSLLKYGSVQRHWAFCTCTECWRSFAMCHRGWSKKDSSNGWDSSSAVGCGKLPEWFRVCAQQSLGSENTASFQWKPSLLRIDPLVVLLGLTPSYLWGIPRSLVPSWFCLLRETSGGGSAPWGWVYRFLLLKAKDIEQGWIEEAAVAWCWARCRETQVRSGESWTKGRRAYHFESKYPV